MARLPGGGSGGKIEGKQLATINDRPDRLFRLRVDTRGPAALCCLPLHFNEEETEGLSAHFMQETLHTVSMYCESVKIISLGMFEQHPV